jgi:serine/threonine-protein kinase
LPQREDLGAEDCYVPPGWFWSGGDPQASQGLPRRRLWLDGHLFRRFPVVNSEYITFLDSLVSSGRTEDALRHAPRARAGTVGEEGSLIYGFDGTHFSLRPDADGDVWKPDVPVLMVDWFGAKAFAEWEAARTGRPWQLPSELAWEKAARGVDGRCFPWGDRFDASRACMRDSHAGRSLPASIHAYPLDESPYGVRGMAGNVADWCLDSKRDGPVLRSSRVETPTVTAAPTGARVNRGGCWYGEAVNLRTADRYWNYPTSRTISLGFRIARHFGT